MRILDVPGLGALLDVLRGDGYTLIGPAVRDGAIVIGEIAGAGDLPRGVGDDQESGIYRLRARADEALFGWAAPAQSFKAALFPARLELVQIRRRGRDLEIADARPPAPRLALVGVRPCDVAALAITDRVLAGGAHPDADYAARRAAAFVVAVQCGEPGATCFCASLGTGPRAAAGFDLALTELTGPHRFLVAIGSPRGGELLARVATREATPLDGAAAEDVVARARARIERELEVKGLPERLAARPEHPRWELVAARCLGCGNCTLVCPTCFCTIVGDVADLTGDVSTRVRVWDSCFTPDFAYVHGGSVRPSLRARYRQWLTHKLSSWVEQFGELGCVGCGRCVTWCPADIDITVEAAAVAAEA
jgi:formate hydrogenlyase subunit 6/NADH:ubiquinone oxidoreductase subunit I